MSWEEIDKIHKIRFGDGYISCDDLSETSFITEVIIEYYSKLSISIVSYSIFKTMNDHEGKVHRNIFWSSLSKRLDCE